MAVWLETRSRDGATTTRTISYTRYVRRELSREIYIYSSLRPIVEGQNKKLVGVNFYFLFFGGVLGCCGFPLVLRELYEYSHLGSFQALSP